MADDPFNFPSGVVSVDVFRNTAAKSFLETVEKPTHYSGLQPSNPFGNPFALGAGGVPESKRLWDSVSEANELPVSGNELFQWLKDVRTKTPLIGESAQIDEKIMEAVRGQESLQTRSVNQSQFNDLCRIQISGARRGEGIGVRLTEDLILTCDHVIENSQEVLVTIPRYVGPKSYQGKDVFFSTARQYRMKRVLDSSPSRNDLDWGKWDKLEKEVTKAGAPLHLVDSLDISVFSIDLSTEEEVISFQSPPEALEFINVFAVTQKLSNQQPDIRRPRNEWLSSDLKDEDLNIYTLNRNLEVEVVSLGNVHLSSDLLHRFRYGNGVSTQKGDSGSPIVIAGREPEQREIVGIHHAETTGGSGQGIPLGAIFQRLERTLHSTDLERIKKENWPVNNTT